MAQRLLRRLCTTCKEMRDATKEEVEVLTKELNGFPSGIEKPDIANIKIGQAKGCIECHGSGYKGRVGVYELILINDEIEKMILKEPSEADVKEAAFRQGQITMRQDGILKIISGLTDLLELERVVG